MHGILGRYYGFDHQILDGLNNRLVVDALLAEVLPKRTQRPLVALPDLGVLVGAIAGAVLIDGVVGQVREHIRKTFRIRSIRVGGKTN